MSWAALPLDDDNAMPGPRKLERGRATEDTGTNNDCVRGSGHVSRVVALSGDGSDGC